MNKPVFDNDLISAQVDIGNMLDRPDAIAEAIADEKAQGSVAADVPAPADHVSAAPDLLNGEQDGTRSIAAFLSAAENADGAPAADMLLNAEVLVSVPVGTHKAGALAIAAGEPVENTSSPSFAVVQPMDAAAVDQPLTLSSIDSTGGTAADTQSTTLVSGMSTTASGDITPTATSPTVVVINGTEGDDIAFYSSLPVSPDTQYLFDMHGGNDTLYASNGDDQLWGDDGDDLLNGLKGNDTFWGGAGFDTVDYSYEGDVYGIQLTWDYLQPDVVKVAAFRFSGVADQDRIHIDAPWTVERIVGSNGANSGDVFVDNAAGTLSWTWDGMAGRDGFRAANGNDTIDGGADADVLEGYAGDDVLYASKGLDDGAADTLWGGLATIGSKGIPGMS